MNKTKDSIRFHREEMAYWYSVMKDAQWRHDAATEQHAKEQYRKHRDVVLAMWASPAERLAVCV